LTILPVILIFPSDMKLELLLLQDANIKIINKGTNSFKLCFIFSLMCPNVLAMGSSGFRSKDLSGRQMVDLKLNCP